VTVEESEQFLERFRVAAHEIKSWPVTAWESMYFQGLGGGTHAAQDDFVSGLLQALEPLSGSQAAQCLESLILFGEPQHQFFPSSAVSMLASLFHKVKEVTLFHPLVHANSVLHVLKSLPCLEILNILSAPGGEGLGAGIVAAGVLALYSHQAPCLHIRVRGSSGLGCEAAWAAFCDVYSGAGICVVNLREN
jgi:hypothetical protein